MSKARGPWAREWPATLLMRMAPTPTGHSGYYAAFRLTTAVLRWLDNQLSDPTPRLPLDLTDDPEIMPRLFSATRLDRSARGSALRQAMAYNLDMTFVDDALLAAVPSIPMDACRLDQEGKTTEFQIVFRTQDPREGPVQLRSATYLHDADLVWMWAIVAADADAPDVIRRAAEQWPGVLGSWFAGRLKRFGPGGALVRPFPATREVQLILLESPLRAVREMGILVAGREDSPG